MNRTARVPVTILTGFLGAGKTTLLQRILADPQGMRIGVLVNDFGAINVDADLIAESTGESVSLQNGCVCCSIRDDMIGAIAGLLDREPAPDRIVIEASGVSRPLPIADALDDDALSDRTALDGIFCLIDGEGFGSLDFAATELAIEQAAGSDVVLLNKTDIASEAALAAIEATLAGPIPRLRLIRTIEGDLPRALLFDTAFDRTDRPSGHAAHHHDHGAHHDHDHEFSTWSWSHEGTVDMSRLRSAMRRLPHDVLRVKGILRAPMGGRIVLQGVGKRIRITPEADAALPARSSVVAIGRPGTLEENWLSDLLGPCGVDA
ncbi:G3E family GTPase [Palleronia aestuarii]|uniref:G3E family GTPase n=1 Tax=Palleronia aestuarii TaxID=568105 RepID=A0A2W7NHG1_9RHOB|nr:GTP-binding protein [Palleronia aestuarii]PZX19865.1 G3E family GTPase [Palleronia aestuarii]